MIGKAKRALTAFVMVLSYSRKIFLRFYLNQRMANFLHGHIAAFEEWGGVPRVILSDNLKSEVLERQGDAIRFNPILLEFAAHYRFEPRPVAVARGNEKGRVERAIRYVRDNFFAARQWTDLDNLNAQAADWCNTVAASRPCPEDKSCSVNEAFLQEKPMLVALPDNPYPADECTIVKVGKTPYVRFDLNDYSIPHTHVRRALTVIAQLDKITILDGAAIVAEHPRSYDKGQQIEQASHIQSLIAEKKNAQLHRGQHRLTHAVPESQALLIQAAAHGYSLSAITTHLLQLLDRYGAAELTIAVNETLSQHSCHPNTVWMHLEKRRQQQQKPPPLTLDLPDDKRVRELVVRPHSLNEYDQLQSLTEKKNDDDNQ